MKRVTLVRLLVTNQDEALEFYTKSWASLRIDTETR
jgi:hypothetical protein